MNSTNKFAAYNAELQRDIAGRAYRGYLCRFSQFDNAWRVSKEGYHIVTRYSLAECKADIDLLVAP